MTDFSFAGFAKLAGVLLGMALCIILTIRYDRNH